MSATEEADIGMVGDQDRDAHKHENSVSEQSHAEVIDSLVNDLSSGLGLKNGETEAEEDLQGSSHDNSPEVSETTKKEQACKCPSDAGGSSASDGDDTHSDSIETLGEEGPPDEEGSLSGALMSGIDFSKSDANSAVDKEAGLGAGEQDEGKDSIIVLADQESDASQLDSHKEAVRPESLSLQMKNDMRVDRKRSESDVVYHREKHHLVERDRSGSEGWAIAQSRAKTSVEEEEKMSKSLPHGTIRRKGDLIEFVADNLQDKIKRSSPMSRTDSGSMGSRQSSMRSLSSACSVCSSTSASTSVATSSGLSRSPSTQFTQSPDDIPPIDPHAVMELENQARLVADNIDLMLGNLRGNLHKMSAITIGCLEAAKCSVDITCDSVDASIKSMYALMAKCEELSKHMPPVNKLASQINEIKRLLDLFEAQLAEKT